MPPILPRSASEAGLPISRRTLLALGLMATAVACKKQPAMRIAAASDLTRVLPLLLNAMKLEGPEPLVTYGSTGKLAVQIEHGAPFDVFLAAHEKYLVGLEAKGAVLAGTRKPFALGRLSVVRKIPCTHEAPLSQLAGPTFARIAIANPEHAPYGAAAREALRNAGIYEAVASRLVLADSVQQAMIFVRSGNVDAAIVARSLVLTDDACAEPIDPASHEPIPQAAAVVKGTHDVDRAKQIVAFLGSEPARTLLVRGGFALPT